FYIASEPVKELDILNEATQTNSKIPAGPFVLRTSINKKEGLMLSLSNNNNEKVVIGYDLQSKQFYINRDSSGATGFAKNFTGTHVAPSISDANVTTLIMYVDQSSIELFTDGGLTVMTSLMFSSKPYNKIQIQSYTAMKTLTITPLKSTWK
ncbi:MAG: GH32 C-terminal domain-containing protein, partial [Bacteroidota bacterium]